MTEEAPGIIEVELDLSRAIVLERTDETPEPTYCVHGHVQCYTCEAWCLLGHKTLAEVQAGATPLCLPCATAFSDRLGPRERVVQDGFGEHD